MQLAAPPVAEFPKRARGSNTPSQPRGTNTRFPSSIDRSLRQPPRLLEILLENEPLDNRTVRTRFAEGERFDEREQRPQLIFFAVFDKPTVETASTRSN